jgi:N-acetyl-anhydromuramyl-L-alanine amidase AmpD
MQQQLNMAQVRTLRSLVLRLCQEYAIAPGRVYTHSEIRRGTTECPGPALTRVVENLRRSFPATSLGN